MLKYILTRDRDLLECFSTVLKSSILGNADLYIYLLTKFKRNSNSCQKHYKIFSYSSWFTATLLTFTREFKAWIQVTGCNKCLVKVADMVMKIPSWLITSESYNKTKKTSLIKRLSNLNILLRWILLYNTLEEKLDTVYRNSSICQH